MKPDGRAAAVESAGAGAVALAGGGKPSWSRGVAAIVRDARVRGALCASAWLLLAIACGAPREDGAVGDAAARDGAGGRAGNGAGVSAHGPGDASGAPPATITLPSAPVEVSIAGGVPVRFDGLPGSVSMGFDTGQSVACLLSRALADRLDVERLGETPVEDGSGHDAVTLELVCLPPFAIGEATFRGALGLVYDGLGHLRGDVPGGSLGFPLFDGCLATLDLPGERLVLARGALPDDGTTMPFALVRGLPHVTMQLAGQPIAAMLDSGSPVLLSLPSALAGSLPLREPPRVVGRMSTLSHTFDVLAATLDGELRVGPHVLVAPELRFNDEFVEPNLGRPFLERFVPTFDVANGRLRLEAREDG